MREHKRSSFLKNCHVVYYWLDALQFFLAHSLSKDRNSVFYKCSFLKGLYGVFFSSKYKAFIYANGRTHITLTAQIFSNTKPGDYILQIPSGALELALIHSQGSV